MTNETEPTPAAMLDASYLVSQHFPDAGGELRARLNAFLAAALDAQERLAQTLFPATAHGDDAHRAWLEKAITDHFAGRPVERPAESIGDAKERLIADKDAKIARLRSALEPFAEQADNWDDVSQLNAHRVEPEFLGISVDQLRKARTALQTTEQMEKT